MSSLEKAKKKKKDPCCEDTDIIIIKQPNDPSVRKSREPKSYDGEYVRDMAGNFVLPTFI